ncbi:MAG: pirin family protein [Methylococcales bacterium]|nr:pirin family protein [Methylococcales bacterium]
MFELRKARERGIADFGWLNSRHTFSFGQYYDPHQQGFSDLLVINDDRVQPDKGFGAHPHADMEIFSYVLEGALEHKDSMGTGSIIKPGDVQMMSAGAGIRHSEFNPSKTDIVHFLQIWIVPEQKQVTPRYQQVRFAEARKRGRLCLIISPDGDEDSLSVYQDVRVFAGLFNGTETAEFELDSNRYAYVHLAQGELNMNGIHLEEGDGVRIREERQLKFSKGNNAEVLVFNLRPNELPGQELF